MDSELLDPEQILASSNTRGNGDGVVVFSVSVFRVCEELVSVDIPFRSQVAWPPEKVGPISLILTQSDEPSAAAALLTLVR